MTPPGQASLPARIESLLAAIAGASAGSRADELLEEASGTVPGFEQLGLVLFAHDDLLFWSTLQMHSDPQGRALRLMASLDITCAPRFVRHIAFPDGSSVLVTRLPDTSYGRLVPFRDAQATLPPAVSAGFWQEMARMGDNGWVNRVVMKLGSDPLLADPERHLVYLLEGWNDLLAVADVSTDDLTAYRTRIDQNLQAL